MLLEFGDQTRLADARLTQHADQLGPLFAQHSAERANQDVQLVLSADEWRMSKCPGTRHRDDVERFPPSQRPVQLLRRNGRHCLVAHLVIRRAVGRLGDQNRRCGAAARQASGHTQRSANQRVLRLRVGTLPHDQHLTGVEPGAYLERRQRIVRQVQREVADRQCGPHGALGVVLVRSRCSEDRERGVTRAPQHGAIQTAYLVRDAFRTFVCQRAQILRIEVLRERGEAAELHGQQRDPAPFLGVRADGLLRRLRAASAGSAAGVVISDSVAA